MNRAAEASCVCCHSIAGKATVLDNLGHSIQQSRLRFLEGPRNGVSTRCGKLKLVTIIERSGVEIALARGFVEMIMEQLFDFEGCVFARQLRARRTKAACGRQLVAMEARALLHNPAPALHCPFRQHESADTMTGDRREAYQRLEAASLFESDDYIKRPPAGLNKARTGRRVSE